MEGRSHANNHFEDKILVCIDCGETFLFSAGEQRFYQSKELSTPKRCKSCREKRRQTLVPDWEVRNG